MHFEVLTTSLLIFILYQISDIKKKIHCLAVVIENIKNERRV